MFRNSLPNVGNAMPPGTTRSYTVRAQGAPPAYQEHAGRQPAAPMRHHVADAFTQRPGFGRFPRTTSSSYAPASVAQPMFGPLGNYDVSHRRPVPQPQQNLYGYSPYIGRRAPFLNGVFGQPQPVYPLGYAPVAPHDAWRRPMYADQGVVEIESFFRVAGALIKGVFCAATWPLRSGWALLTRGELASFWR